MITKIIALGGVHDTGKTHTLEDLKTVLQTRHNVVFTTQNPITNPPDNRYWGVFNGKRIAICTGGDNGKMIVDNFDWARTRNCDVLITATRLQARSSALLELLSESQKTGVVPHLLAMVEMGSRFPQATIRQQVVRDIASLI